MSQFTRVPHVRPGGWVFLQKSSTGHEVSVPAPQTDTELVLIRGLPGSGKSTMAGALALIGLEHFEADMYFVVDGIYRHVATRIRDAHAWCQQQTRQALERGARVVVSNTFTRLDEMTPYRTMTTRLRIVEAAGNWGSVHGVPADMLKRIASRWERLPA